VTTSCSFSGSASALLRIVSVKLIILKSWTGSCELPEHGPHEVKKVVMIVRKMVRLSAW
jgi:hypothetical protein